MVEELYIIAPLAVMLELLKVKSAKSVRAVVLEVVGVTLVKAAPPELYPVPDVSLLVVKAVVAASDSHYIVLKSLAKSSCPLFTRLFDKVVRSLFIACLAVWTITQYIFSRKA